MSETTTGRADTSEINRDVTVGLAAVRAPLPQAAALAEAAKVCARAGSGREAMGIVLNLDAPLGQIQSPHGVIYLIVRINRPAAEATASGD